ncbi:hypothetical protein H1R20_g3874, partial [Candolleomyces eurysporus]
MTNRSKTHANPGRVAEISSMSRTAKIAENLAITARNGIKKVIHGLKAKGVSPANLTKYMEGLEPKVNPDSDVESLISLPEEEAPPAASDPAADFRQMVGEFTSAIQSSLKRPVSPSRELESTLAKKLKSTCRPELDLDVSQALDPVVAKEVDMLDHAGFYSHLGLFTRDAIDFISFNANLIKTVRATIDVDGKATTIRVIDANHKRIPKEHLLSHRDWYGASTAQLVWAQNVRKDDLWAKWLFAHFTWCSSTYGAQGADYDFTCILLVDITMRKKYHLQPFMFKPGMHKDLLNDIRQEYRLAQDKWTYVHEKLGIICYVITPRWTLNNEYIRLDIVPHLTLAGGIDLTLGQVLLTIPIVHLLVLFDSLNVSQLSPSAQELKDFDPSNSHLSTLSKNIFSEQKELPLVTPLNLLHFFPSRILLVLPRFPLNRFFSPKQLAKEVFFPTRSTLGNVTPQAPESQ